MGFFSKKKKTIIDIDTDVDNTPTIKIANAMEYKIDTAMSMHIGTRNYQQDAAYVTDPIREYGNAFAVLCDGMGGLEHGELASSDVVEFFANALSNISADDNIPAFYQAAVEHANDIIKERYVDKGMQVGTTLVSIFITKNQLYWASVGDSRIYIIRNKEIACLTNDHNYGYRLKEFVEQGIMTQEEADSDPNREALISYIGAPELEVIDISRNGFLLEYGDLILLCSDGLTKILSKEEILQQVSIHPDNLSESAHRLIVASMDSHMGSQDNTSVILVRHFNNMDPTTHSSREKTVK